MLNVAEPNKVLDDIQVLQTDRYCFFETDTDIFIFLPISGQFPTFDWPPVPIFQYKLTDIFANILTKYFG